MGGNNSANAGGANDLVGSHWDWDDDDRGMGMDIQSLLSEFGDFGDFFEDEVLAIGEVNILVEKRYDYGTMHTVKTESAYLKFTIFLGFS